MTYSTNNEYIDTLLHYVSQHLTLDQLQQIRQIPLYGSNGLRRWIAQRSIEAFVKLYFPNEFTLPFAPYQLDIVQDLQQVHDRQAAGLAGLRLAKAYPRGHSKSTYYSRVLPLHAFLYGWSPLTVLLANNDDAAKRLVNHIKTAIETNPLLVEDFPTAKGSRWGSEWLESSSGNVITSFGIGSGGIRGVSTGANRPSLVIGDDIDDDKSVRSAVELAHNKEWFDKSVMQLGAIDGSTSFIIVGTIIRKTSLMKYIIDSADFNSIVESRIKQWSSNAELWQQWSDWYLNTAREGIQPSSADDDTFYQANKDTMLANTQVLWDRPNDYYNAMVYKLARGDKAFNSEMQNNPLDSDSLFGSVPYINLATINENEYDLLAALDPTVQGGKKNDLAAYVEILFNRKRKEMIVSYVDAKQRSYGQTIDVITRRIVSRGKRFDGFWIEDNAHGLIVKDLINEKFRQQRIPLVANGIYNTIPKYDRIGVLSEYIERGQLLFADTLPHEVSDELSLYPMTHDDILDAISLIVIYLKDNKMIDLIHI